MSFEDSTLWELAGPAAGSWYVLVLSGQHAGPGMVPHVTVAPVRLGLSAADATAGDVFCPASQSPLGDPLVIAAWATASMPAHCLSRQIGAMDESVVNQVRETYENLVNAPRSSPLNPLRPRIGEPAWHRDLRKTLHGYWDGSVMISCATEKGTAKLAS